MKGLRSSPGASGPQSLLQLLPQTPSIRSTHKSFNNVFRSSRLATIQNISSQDPSFYTRHRQHHPRHQVISSFNAAHRWGDWGLKRPFPLVKDAHIIVTEFDTQERQTPYTFATEKPRFVRRMREFGLILEVPISDTRLSKTLEYRLPERQARRPRSPLQHLHPQWLRGSGNETGPRILTLSAYEFRKFLRTIEGKRAELDASRLRLGITDNQSEATKQLVQACLDLPLRKPIYQTHPTAGLSYSIKGSIPSTPAGTKSDTRTMIGGTRPGRLLKLKAGPVMNTFHTALVYGIVAKVEKGQRFSPDRSEPVALKVESANVNPFGRLELTMSPA